MLLVSHRSDVIRAATSGWRSDTWVKTLWSKPVSPEVFAQLTEYLLEAADIFMWSSVVLKQVIPVELKQFKDTGMSVYATESPPLLF